MSTIKFENGKFYKTRGGKKAECVHTNAAGGGENLLFVVEGDSYFSTYTDGMYLPTGGEHYYDIISEWPEERVVWVVCAGELGTPSVLDSYSAAKNLYNCYWHMPTRSLTRVVIQDGHIDTE